jgi:hypothetical protein
MLEGKEYCNIAHMEENQKESIQNTVFLISSQKFQHALNNVFVKGDMSVILWVAPSFHWLSILSKSLELTP